MKDKPRKQHGHTRKPSVSTRVWPLPLSCPTNLLSTPVASQVDVVSVVDRPTLREELDNGNDHSIARRAPSVDSATRINGTNNTHRAASITRVPRSECRTSTTYDTSRPRLPSSSVSELLSVQRQPLLSQPAPDTGRRQDVDSENSAAQVGSHPSHIIPPIRWTRGRQTQRKQSNPARWTPLSRPKRPRPARPASVSTSPAAKRSRGALAASVNRVPPTPHLNAHMSAPVSGPQHLTSGLDPAQAVHDLRVGHPPTSTRPGGPPLHGHHHPRKRPSTLSTGKGTPHTGPRPSGRLGARPAVLHDTPLPDTMVAPIPRPVTDIRTDPPALSPAAPHPRYLPRACKPPPPPPSPDRDYMQVYPAGSGARVGLAKSDIPLAGWGVFALRDLRPGTHVLEYGGVRRERGWAEQPNNDARYVWSDENQADELEAAGREVLYIDANPALSDSWGGRVNDGFHRGANLVATRLQDRDKVMLKITVPVSAGEELYLSYGADYWQGHFFDLPLEVQAEAAAHYDLLVLDGTCYTPAQRGAAVKAGLIHRRGGQWRTGPAPLPPLKSPRPPIPPLRLPHGRGPTPPPPREPTYPPTAAGRQPDSPHQGDTRGAPTSPHMVDRHTDEPHTDARAVSHGLPRSHTLTTTGIVPRHHALLPALRRTHPFRAPPRPCPLTPSSRETSSAPPSRIASGLGGPPRPIHTRCWRRSYAPRPLTSVASLPRSQHETQRWRSDTGVHLPPHPFLGFTPDPWTASSPTTL